ncbi:hypothetical protein Dsin_002682 [Dipteronia sinensis]|uniref:Uncharacterized protein n=1 Tax=Dipteronia sinensis TaxID=43782 RepID=A0AAE0B681_9ROSI|nr:hypothetical protein Dsin_002682 [Dipteronia sinensis]
MAMAGAGLEGVSLAEAYAMRVIYKKNLKKADHDQRSCTVVADHRDDDHEVKLPSGCFFQIFKKQTRSSKVSSADSRQQNKLNGRLDCKT